MVYDGVTYVGALRGIHRSEEESLFRSRLYQIDLKEFGSQNGVRLVLTETAIKELARMLERKNLYADSVPLGE